MKNQRPDKLQMTNYKYQMSKFLFLASQLATAGWFALNSGTSNALLSVHFPVDTITGYVVGWDGTILKTTDGGLTFSTQNSGTVNPLSSVHFPVDAVTGYAVGDYGTILKTTDGGNTWESQNYNTNSFLRSVHFPVDDRTGYAVGWPGIILKTMDGGVTWLCQFSNPDIYLYSVHFPERDNIGYTVGLNWNTNSGTVLKTTDGGVTWIEQPLPTDPLLSVYFPVDAAIGYIAGDYGTILKTTDGGATWISQISSYPSYLLSVHFPVDAMTGYIVGHGGTILKTIDGGATWVHQSSGVGSELWSVHFPVDVSTGYTVGVLGVVLKTTNGGVAVEEGDLQTRATARLFQNFPNPFSAQTSISYEIVCPAQVKLSAYNMAGQIVKTLTSGLKPAGVYRVFWDGTNDSGHRLPSGVYFICFVVNPVGEAGDFKKVEKAILLR